MIALRTTTLMLALFVAAVPGPVIALERVPQEKVIDGSDPEVPDRPMVDPWRVGGDDEYRPKEPTERVRHAKWELVLGLVIFVVIIIYAFFRWQGRQYSRR